MFVRFSTVAGSRGSADTARDVRGFATKFYTPEGIWDLVGNNIPVFFIQDGIKFPDIIHAAKPEPDREIPQAADRPRHLLGLRVAHARVHPHAHVGHVRPGHPPLVPDDGGLRRPHLPPGQRSGRHHAGQVPLEAGGRHPLPGVGGVPEAGRHRPRLPPPRPVGRHRGRGRRRVRPRRPAVPRQRGPELRGHRPARPHQARPRGAGPGAASSGGSPSTATRPTSSPRPSRSPSAPPTSRGASTSPTTPCCRPATSPTSTPSSPAWAGPTSTSCRSTGPVRR